MNCTEANEINIVGFLQERGFKLGKSSGADHWYCSPLRSEETPSFKVNAVKNVWFDYGTGTGGKLIDLVCQIYSVDVPGSLQIISGSSPAIKPFSFDEQKQPLPVEGIKINHIQKLQNVALIQYLENRKIPFEIADLYLNQAYYEAKNKKYFAIAFKNDLGGYELRNKYFKGSNSPKGITTLQSNQSTKSVNVFEGFMDYLSALVYFGVKKPYDTTIILNSVSHLGRVFNILEQYQEINLYLDNDKAGEDTANRITAKYPKTVNRSKRLYPDNKDFNEFLILK